MDYRLSRRCGAAFFGRCFSKLSAMVVCLSVVLFGSCVSASQSETEFAILPVEVVQPAVRESDIRQEPISIPPDALSAFAGHPLLMEEIAPDQSGRVLVGLDGQFLFGQFSQILAKSVATSESGLYSIVRRGREIVHPMSKEPLAVPALFLGIARLEERGDISKLTIVKSTAEISSGDTLVPYEENEELGVLTPTVSETPISAYVASTLSAVGGAGTYSIIMISAGSRDGVASGDVLSVLSPERRLLVTERDPVTRKASNGCRAYAPEQTSGARILGCGDREPSGRELRGRSSELIDLPEIDAGELIVVRVFEKVSFAFIKRASRSIETGDRVVNMGG